MSALFCGVGLETAHSLPVPRVTGENALLSLKRHPSTVVFLPVCLAVARLGQGWRMLSCGAILKFVGVGCVPFRSDLCRVIGGFCVRRGFGIALRTRVHVKAVICCQKTALRACAILYASLAPEISSHKLIFKLKINHAVCVRGLQSCRVCKRCCRVCKVVRALTFQRTRAARSRSLPRLEGDDERGG